AVVRLPNPKLKTLGERGIKCIFIGHAEHSKGFRFYVIEPNDSVLINSIIELRDAIFDENRFSSVPRPSLKIPNRTEDIGGSVVPEEVTKKDVAFWKEAINDEMDSIMGNNTWVLADLPPGCKPLGCKWIFKRKLKSHYIEKVLKKFIYFDCTQVSTPMDTSEKLMPNNGHCVSQLEYSRVIGYLLYAMTCTRPDIAFVVGKLSRYTINPSTQHLADANSAVLEGYTDCKLIVTLKTIRIYKWLGFPACAATLARVISRCNNGNSRTLRCQAYNMITM
ncbi:zinc finger, CCHC-type containing protein, partial [Tanacetum coccineum]